MWLGILCTLLLTFYLLCYLFLADVTCFLQLANMLQETSNVRAKNEKQVQAKRRRGRGCESASVARHLVMWAYVGHAQRFGTAFVRRTLLLLLYEGAVYRSSIVACEGVQWQGRQLCGISGTFMLVYSMTSARSGYIQKLGETAAVCVLVPAGARGAK